MRPVHRELGISGLVTPLLGSRHATFWRRTMAAILQGKFDLATDKLDNRKRIAEIWDQLRSPVAEQFLAFAAEKSADNGNGVIALLEDKTARDETSSPLIIFRTTLAAIRSDVLLGNAVDDRANSRPHAGTSAHGTGFVGGVKDEVGQVPAIAA